MGRWLSALKYSGSLLQGPWSVGGEVLERSQRGWDPGLCPKPSHFMERGGFQWVLPPIPARCARGAGALGVREIMLQLGNCEYNVSRSELPPGVGYAGINETITKLSALCTDRGVICLDSGLNISYWCEALSRIWLLPGNKAKPTEMRIKNHWNFTFIALQTEVWVHPGLWCWDKMPASSWRAASPVKFHCFKAKPKNLTLELW